MSEFFPHHVKEEKNETFSPARKTRLDMAAPRDAMLAQGVG